MAVTPRSVMELAEVVGGTVLGGQDIKITGVAGLAEAQSGDISFLANPKYEHLLHQTGASAVIVGRHVTEGPCMLIQVDNPDLAFAQVVECILPPVPKLPAGIHPTALIHPDAVLGTDVAVGPHVVIEQGARIGNASVIHAGVFVGERSVVGADSVLHPNVVIYHDCTLGARVILHAGVVIGCDGFGYAWDGTKHAKIPQRGTVEIGDDVEIGSNTVVDRARFGKTVVARGTKLDNLIQIAHNVRVGEHCVFAALSGVSGSTQIGAGTMMGGQAATVGHIAVGPRNIISARSVATRNTGEGEHITGFPARPHREFLRDLANIRKISEMRDMIKELERKVDALESQTKDNQ